MTLMRDGEAHRLPRTWHVLSSGHIISLSDSQLDMITHTVRAVSVEMTSNRKDKAWGIQQRRQWSPQAL